VGAVQIDVVGVAEAALEASPNLIVDGRTIVEAELHEGGSRVRGIRMLRVCGVAEEVTDDDDARGATFVGRAGFALSIPDGVTIEADGDGGVGAIEPFDGVGVVGSGFAVRFKAGAFDGVGGGGGGPGGAEYHLEVFQVAWVFA
jgi:hypothetical protein